MFEDSIPRGVIPASPEESMRAHMNALTKNPYETQVGGNHYSKMAIQPMEYSMANGFDALQHTIVKYVSRFRSKNGIQDLEKARHCIDMLIQFEKNKGA